MNNKKIELNNKNIELNNMSEIIRIPNIEKYTQ